MDKIKTSDFPEKGSMTAQREVFIRMSQQSAFVPVLSSFLSKT